MTVFEPTTESSASPEESLVDPTPHDDAPPPPGAAASSSRSSKERTAAITSPAATTETNSFDFEKYGTAHIPEDKDQRLVQTPYGTGLVVRTRRLKLTSNNKRSSAEVTSSMREMELIDWDPIRQQEYLHNQQQGSNPEPSSASPLAARKGPKRPATLYTPLKYPSIPTKLNDQVICAYGRGTVIALRPPPNADTNSTQSSPQQQGVAVVLLSSWRLAGRSRVKCYLTLDAVEVVRPKKLYEMSVYERVEYGQDLKLQANTFFTTQKYEQALQLYVQAIESVRYVQHRVGDASNNHVRADLVHLLITCYNNAATCASHVTSGSSSNLDPWDEVGRHAKNALVLIDALEEKKGLKIHSLLQREGTSDLKLFGEWKAKALVLQARSCMERRHSDLQQAIYLLQQARQVILAYSTSSSTTSNGSAAKSPVSPLLSSLDKQVKKLLVACKERRKEERHRERQQALKMFAKSSLDDGEEKKERSTPESSPRTSPILQNNDNKQGGGDNGALHPDASLNGSESSRLRLHHLSPNTAKKRVSFSEHVSEKLYVPEPPPAEETQVDDHNDTRSTGRPLSPLTVEFMSWLNPNVVWIGWGMLVGIVLTSVGGRLLSDKSGPSSSSGGGSSSKR